jgi:hypothetical protein
MNLMIFWKDFNMAIVWQSRHRYKVNGAVGHVTFTTSNVYMLVDKSGVLFPVPIEKGTAIQALEGSMPETGRPSLFPGKKVESRSITLPAEYWRKMKEPYSIAIGAAVLNTYFVKKD